MAQSKENEGLTRRLLAETNEKHKVAYDRIDAERTAASLALESARADLARHGMDVAKLAEELARTQRISAQLQVKAGFGRSLIRSGYPRVQELNFFDVDAAGCRREGVARRVSARVHITPRREHRAAC